jgi:hypothetical protein
MNILGAIVRRLCIGFGWLALTFGIAWAFGALWFDFRVPSARHAVAFAFVIGTLITLILSRTRRWGKLAVSIAVMAIAAWWLTLQPLQERDWKPEVAVLARAEVEGDRITIHNVRDFDYRSENDFLERRETRSYNLANLRGVDLFVTYWGSPLIAHPILSFNFGPNGHLCFSIETRSQLGQSYSALRGFYRQFEQIYVAADERDVIRLRTNFRQGEDVYLYRFITSPATARFAFLQYVRSLNELAARPRWYNAIQNNCTTAIRNQRAAVERVPWDWRMLVNGYADEMLYERGMIDRLSLPFDELKRRSHINARAQATDAVSDFSERIRTHFPEG